MSWWDDYKRRRGIEVRQKKINRFQSLISKQLENSINFKKIKINNVDCDAKIIEKSSLTKNIDEKKIICKLSTGLGTGDIIEWIATQSRYWLCTEIDEDITVYEKGVIKPCNYLLKWMDSKGNIIQLPCIISNKTLYTDGTKVKKVPLGDTKISIQIQNNDDTYKLVRDFRVIVGRTVYKITNDTEIYTTKGLITLIATETEKRPNDNFEIGIADNGVEIVEPSTSNLVIEGESIIYWIDYIWEYVAKLYDDDNVLIEPQPNITYTITSGSEYVVTSQDENIFKIKPIITEDRVLKTIILSVIDGTNTIEKTIKIKGAI